MTTPPKPDHEKRPFRFKLEGPFLRVSTMLLITPISPNFKGLKCSVFGCFRALQSRNVYGYNVHWQVLNAKNYGIPQNRERVYCVIIRKDLDNGRFKFPEPISLKHTLADMLETDVDEKYYLSDEKVAAMITPPPQRISKTIRVGGRNSADRQHQWDLVAENARSSIE